MPARTSGIARWVFCGIVGALLSATASPAQAQGAAQPVLQTRPVTRAGTLSPVGQADATSVDGQAAALLADRDPAPDRPGRGGNREHHRKQPKKATAGATAKAPNPNCTLAVPDAPLTAQGLATPYEMTATQRRKGPCHEANADQSAFVEATILDPATGDLSVYRPLVIDHGTQPAVPPIMPTLPPDSVVGIWFGFQRDTLTLDGATSGYVNVQRDSLFGQFEIGRASCRERV